MTLSDAWNLTSVVLNVMLLGLNLKLYTEILKEKSQRERRPQEPPHDGE